MPTPWYTDLSRSQIQDVADTSQLEHYWEKHSLNSTDMANEGPNESTDSFGRIGGYRKSRSMSTATNYLHSTHHLTPHHPASNLLDSVKLFGPLIFPLFRAALLRKRILIITEAPVEFSCDLGTEATSRHVPPTDQSSSVQHFYSILIVQVIIVSPARVKHRPNKASSLIYGRRIGH